MLKLFTTESCTGAQTEDDCRKVLPIDWRVFCGFQFKFAQC